MYFHLALLFNGRITAVAVYIAWAFAVPFLWASLCMTALAEESGLAVIVGSHSSITKLTREQVADIFLGRSANPGQWHPIDSKDEAIREHFYQVVAGISANRARAQWARLVFSARLAPPREMSSKELSALIGADALAIAYINKHQLPKDFRVLLDLP